MGYFFKNKKSTWISFFILLFFVFPTPIVLGTGSWAFSGSNAVEGFLGLFPDLGAWLGYALISTGAVVTLFGGTLLEMALQAVVVGFGALINGSASGVGDAGLSALQSSNLGNTIDRIWTIVRDVCNLAFIFGFLYIGIRLIFNAESSDAKKKLAALIIAALLINFSLFITKVVIEFGNLTAYTIYEQMVDEEQMKGSIANGTITGTMMNLLGLSGFYDPQDPEALKNLTNSGALWFFILGFVFMLVAGFIFFAGAILLLSRFVALLFIMMFSPVLFAATIFPGTSQYASLLWKKLLGYTFFAPAYLFMLFVAIEVLKGFKFGGEGGNNFKEFAEEVGAGSVSLKTDGDAYTIFLQFTVAILMLYLALSLSKKLSIAGGDMVLRMGTSARKKAQGLLGRGALSLTGINALTNTLAKKQEEYRKSDSGLRRGVALGMRATGIDTAAKATQKANFGSGRSLADVRKEKDQYKREQARSGQVSQTATNIESGATAPAGSQQKIDMERSITNSSTEQLLALLKKYKKGPERDAILANLSSSQFDNLMKVDPEKLNDEEKADIRKARAGAVTSRLGITATTPHNIRDASSNELESIDFKTLESYAGWLSAKQIDDMKGLTTTEKSRLKTERENQLGTLLASSGAAAVLARAGTDAEIAKLPVSILTDSNVAFLLNTNVLSKIMDNDKITPAQRALIKSSATSAAAVDFFKTDRGKAF